MTQILAADAEKERISRTLSEWYSEYLEAIKIPDVLYHYTDGNGALGIINSASVWATNIAYLNDKREYDYAVSMLIDRARGLSAVVTDDTAKAWLSYIARRLDDERWGGGRAEFFCDLLFGSAR
jgi:hypothetical protein